VADQFSIEWHDSGREPKCAPNPDYPNGIDLGGAKDGVPSCRVDLPYPAKRCGYYVVRCGICCLSVGITTAGRPDDPRSAILPCLGMEGVTQ
jgi:hypothetical protein